MMRFIKMISIFVVIGTILFLISCSDDEPTNPQDQSPTIPPQSTMVMDFSEFPDTSSPAVLQKVTFLRKTYQLK